MGEDSNEWLGYNQSANPEKEEIEGLINQRNEARGDKDFKLADPLKHEDLFKIAEENIKYIEQNENNFKKYELLIKLLDKAEIINEIN